MLVQDNLDRLYGDLPHDLAKNLPAKQDGAHINFCHLPIDGRAEVGEYTSRKILNLID